MTKLHPQIRRILTKTYVQVFIFIGLFLLIAWAGNTYLQPKDTSDISGWIQTALALLAVPLIIVQLREIRRSLIETSSLSIGVIGTARLTIVDLIDIENLPTEATVSLIDQSFRLIIRNSGSKGAKNIKMLLDHSNFDLIEENNSRQKVPYLISSETSQNKINFFPETHRIFYCRPESGWMIHPHDLEVFKFDIVYKMPTYAHVKEEWPEAPAAKSTIELTCVIWAEGLPQRIEQKLTIAIVTKYEDLLPDPKP